MLVGDFVNLITLNQARNIAILKGIRQRKDEISSNDLGDDHPNSSIIIPSSMFQSFGKGGVIQNINIEDRGHLLTIGNISGSWNNWMTREYYIV